MIAHFDLHGDPHRMVEDADGSVWATLTNPRGALGPLCHVTDTNARCLGEADGITFYRADAILPDGKGGFWIGTSKSLVHWNSGRSSEFECKALRSNAGQEGIQSMVPNSDGSFWVATGAGLEKFIGDHFQPFVTRDFDGSKISVFRLLKDRDQDLWVATADQGIYRIRGETVDHFGLADGLSSDTVRALYEDKEGIIWAGTSNGLDSFSDRSVATFSRAEGLSHDDVQSVLASRDGTIWAGNGRSLDYIKNGVIGSIRPSEGLPGRQVASLLEDRAGHLWVGVDDGLFLYQNGRFLRLPEPNHRPLGLVAGITEDVDGDIWAECASNPRKLVRIRDFHVQAEFLSSQVPSGHSIAADPKGGIWIATLDGDLVYFHNGALKTFRSNLRGEFPRQIEAEPDGTVLAAAPYGGLIGLRMGKIQVLTTRNGLPCDGVLGFVEDNEKNRWLETPCGYAMVADSEMQRWWVHPDTRVQYRFFDVSEGARTRSVSFNASAKSPDGRLWFATHLLQTIDPRHPLFNNLPPPVRIENITADHKVYEIDSAGTGNIRLPPLVRDLEIDYTALSLVAPQKIRFRIKLEGRDRYWKDVGNERKTFYNDLPPRNYRFRVAACNNDGVWNEAGGSFDFSIDPAYYQTAWFRASCAAAFLALLWALYRFRIHQIAQQFNVRLEERVNERTRLARDLHDTLLQTVQAGRGLAELALSQNTDAHQLHKYMERLYNWLTRATDEGRAALRSLRMTDLEGCGLAEGLRRAGEECQSGGSIQFVLDLKGTYREIHPVVRDEVYRIGYEAIRNAYLHSGATSLQVELVYGDRLVLRVHDNGKGMEPEIARHGKQGRFGVAGMYERAAQIHGHLTVSSAVQTGTEIELSVAGKHAFVRPKLDPFRFVQRLRLSFRRKTT